MELEISFIIPVYNAKIRIKKCLESILNQSISNIEIICIDDCSNDDSLKIIEAYQKKNSNIIIIKNSENLGAGASRNLGLKTARGKYIWFVDADDYICEKSIYEINEIIKKKSLDVLIFSMRWVSEIEELIASYKIPDYNGEIYDGKEMFKKICLNNDFRNSACRQLYRLEYLKEHNIFFTEGAMAEDAFFALRALLEADRVQCITFPFYVYNKSQNSVTTHSIPAKRFIGMFTAFSDMFQYWYARQYDQEISEMIIKYLSKNLVEANNNYRMIDKEVISKGIKEQEKNVNQLYQIFSQIKQTNNYIKEISPYNLEKLQINERILIYGAGNVAREIVKILDGLEKRILAFVVSDDALNNPKAIWGVPVIKNSELDSYKKDDLIIIAMLPEKAKGVEEKLIEKGFTNIIRIVK